MTRWLLALALLLLSLVLVQCTPLASVLYTYSTSYSKAWSTAAAVSRSGLAIRRTAVGATVLRMAE